MPPAARFPDWQSRLDVCIRERRRRAFRWGRQDCALFAADCALATTGVDLAAGERGYDSEFGAGRVLASYGSVDALATAKLGPPIATPLLARTGDVGAVVTPGGRSLAVCTGQHWLVPGELGLLTLPLRSAERAWRVG